MPAHAATADAHEAQRAIATHAVALDRLQTGATRVRIATENGDDVSRAVWNGLPAALERLEAADPEAFAPVRAEVRALSLDRIARIEAERTALPARSHEDLDRALREGVPAATGRPPLEKLLLRAHAIDHLRVLNEDGVLFGEMGWAARRWAWADLHEAVLGLAREERATHDRLARDADALVARAAG